ncbi:MAG: hypothetical protein HY290_29655 [Planctomycetia bacterium]|nr:hypothetical protein [Planctomycetia bacterium]
MAVAVVLLALAARVAWHASRAEVGWELVRRDWGKTWAGLAGIERTEFSRQEPEQQARFWLQEVERIGAANRGPQVAAGAAWLLDAPGYGFLQRHYRENKAVAGIPGLPFGARVELDYSTINRTVDRFEELCHVQCLALIEHATQIDAANAEIWRTRALLLYRNDFLGIGFKPREPDWRAVLDECTEHDPENALYDYLAALTEWTSAADHQWHLEGYTLEVRDAEGYERGNRRFAAGLAKPQLMFGNHGDLDIMAFLENTSVTPMDRLQAAEGRAANVSRAANLLYSLLRWQGRQQSARRRSGDFSAAAASGREMLHVTRQVSIEGNPALLISEPLIVRRFTLASLSDLSSFVPDIFDAHEIQAFGGDRRQVLLELEVLDEVGRRLKAKDRPAQGRPDGAAASLSGISQPFVETLLPIALCFTILAWLCRKGRDAESVRAGGLGHVAACIAALGLSYVVFGLCPVGIISARIQTWVVRGAVAVPFVLALIGIFFVLNRRFPIGFSKLMAVSISVALVWAVFFYWSDLPGLMIWLVGSLYPWATILFSIALLGTIWFMVKTDLAFLQRADIPTHRKLWLAFLLQVLAVFTVPWGPTIAELAREHLATQIWVPSRVWGEMRALGITADDLPNTLTGHRWMWSLLQWVTYQGPYIGLALSFLFLVAPLAIRLCRATAGGFRQVLRQEKTRCLRLIATTAARSVLLAAVGALGVYFATVPAAIETGEAWYQRHYSRLADPHAARREIDAEIASIRNDPSLMAELERRAEK